MKEIWRKGLWRVGQLYLIEENGKLDPGNTVPEVQELKNLNFSMNLKMTALL